MYVISPKNIFSVYQNADAYIQHDPSTRHLSYCERPLEERYSYIDI